MAKAALNTWDLCQCSVCLDRLNDPVTIPCGHSFCRKCISSFWNQEDQKGVYSCPQCRETFNPRPILKKNTILAELMGELKTAETQEGSSGHCLAGPGDVECDFCTERKLKAVKSCLVCLASFCETHVQPHYKSTAFKKHKLVKVSAHLQEKICAQHDRLLDVFCRTDQKCICMLCTMDEHKGHDTASAAAERNEKQIKLEAARKKSNQQIQETERELLALRESLLVHKDCVGRTVEHSEIFFRDLIKSIKNYHAEVIELIRDQEKLAVSQAEKAIKDLEQEIAGMRRRMTQLDQLSHEEDHVHFLQSYQNLHLSAVCRNLHSAIFSHNLSFEDPDLALSILQQNVERLLHLQMEQLTKQVGAKGRSFVTTVDGRGTIEHDNCPICMDELTNEKKLPCGHVFCEDCLRLSIESLGSSCPVCKKVFGKVKGDQPDGSMKHHIEKYALPGFNRCYTIVIDYIIPDGIQSDKHPKPGRSFRGIQRRAYLPDNKEGKEVLALLRRAFEQRLIFTVGTSRTSGMDDCVTWNDVHHKTNTHGGPQNFGYPDDGYLKRVREELKAKGVE